MNEESQSGMVHDIRLGKGEGFSHEAPQTLAQSAIEAFAMVGLGFGLILRKLLCRDNAGISLPNVGKAVRLFISFWNRLPQFFAGFSAATADDKSYHLARAPTECQPNSAFIFTAQHKTPEFIQFQDITSLKRGQGAFQGRQLSDFF